MSTTTRRRDRGRPWWEPSDEEVDAAIAKAGEVARPLIMVAFLGAASIAAARAAFRIARSVERSRR